jgi:hypothetical protein
MIYTRTEILAMIYESEEHLNIMIEHFKKYDDYEFLNFAKQYFITIKLISKNKYVI